MEMIALSRYLPYLHLHVEYAPLTIGATGRYHWSVHSYAQVAEQLSYVHKVVSSNCAAFKMLFQVKIN